jgi:hypothetical protein
MKRRIFTTDPAFDFTFDRIDAVQGFGFTTLVSHIDLKELKTKKHKSGRNIIDHDWFQEHLTDKSPGFQSVGLHLLPKDRSRLKLDGSIHGQHIGDRDDVNEYFVCASTQKDFDKRVLHEEGHEYETDDISLHYYATRGDFETFYRRIRPSSFMDILKLKLKALQLQLAQLLMRKTFLQACTEALGTDATPDDLVPDTVACAITVSTLIRKVDPSFPLIAGTWTLWDVVRHRKDWQLVSEPVPGALVLSPTGTGKKGTVGHVGVIMEDGTIASNNSKTGKFEKNYTLASWRAYFAVKQGMPVHIFVNRKLTI